MEKEKTSEEIILISITGRDKMGLTSALTEVLARYDAKVLDIGQASIHSYLSLGVLFFSPDEATSGRIMRELLFKAEELSVKITFTPIERDHYDFWVKQQGKERYIVTLLGEKLSAAQISAVARIVSQQGMNIDDIKRLTGRVPLEKSERQLQRACVEFSLRGTPRDKARMQESFWEISERLGFDISFQEDNLFRRSRRLICFDMDSTLIKTEVIDELAKEAGVEGKVKEITERAMRGELDFKESFKERLRLLEGLDAGVLPKIAERLPLMDGAERVFKVLKRTGYKIAILSGGFSYFGNYLKQKFALDYVYANELEIVDGKLSGRYLGDVVDANRKAELLRLIAQVENVDLQQVIAVGDGANDLKMLSVAGLGIAFHAKPIVKESARQAISLAGLDGILYFLGFKDSYID